MIPRCARCHTVIGWTRWIRGARHCEACAIAIAHENRNRQERRS